MTGWDPAGVNWAVRGTASIRSNRLLEKSEWSCSPRLLHQCIQNIALQDLKQEAFPEHNLNELNGKPSDSPAGIAER